MKRISFTSTDAKLKKINNRTEMHGEDTKIAIDLKFECAVDAGLLKILLNAEDVPPFWNEDGSLRYVGLGMIPIRAELAACLVEFGDLVFSKICIEGASVNEFKFQPASGKCIKLQLRVQHNPTDEELVRFSHAVMKTMELHISTEVPCKTEDPDAGIFGEGEEDPSED